MAAIHLCRQLAARNRWRDLLAKSVARSHHPRGIRRRVLPSGAFPKRTNSPVDRENAPYHAEV